MPVASSAGPQREALPSWGAFPSSMTNIMTATLRWRFLSLPFRQLAQTTDLWNAAMDKTVKNPLRSQEIRETRKRKKEIVSEKKIKIKVESQERFGKIGRGFGRKGNDEMDVVYVVVVRTLDHLLKNFSGQKHSFL